MFEKIEGGPTMPQVYWLLCQRHILPFGKKLSAMPSSLGSALN